MRRAAALLAALALLLLPGCGQSGAGWEGPDVYKRQLINRRDRQIEGETTMTKTAGLSSVPWKAKLLSLIHI